MSQGRGRDFWAGIISEYDQAGVPQREFAEARDLNLATFQHWLYRLRRETPRLLPVRVTASAPSAVIEVCAAGVVLRVPAGADVQQVASLVSALEQREC